MPRAKVRRRTSRIAYTPGPGVITESERVQVYRARAVVVKRLDQLLALGKYERAIQLALPITARLDAAPATDPLDAVLDTLTLVDAREDVARALYRQDPAKHHASYKAHLHLLIQRAQTALRAMEDTE